MDERFESYEQGWRRPTTYEQDAVIKWMREAIQNRLLGFYLSGGFFILVLGFMSLVASSEKIKGEPQVMHGVLTFVIGTAIIVVICLLLNIRQYLLLRKVKAGEFTITERPVLDKIAIAGRGIDIIHDLGSGYHVAVELKEGEKRYVRMTTMSEDVYFEKVNLGTEVTLIKYNDYRYGFYDDIDCMLMGKKV